MADNLESYFKKHLSDESPGKDKWNVPSEKVWENALPEIRKKKGLFIPWRYLYLLGFLTVIVAGVIIWQIYTPGPPSEEQISINNASGSWQNEIVPAEPSAEEPATEPVSEPVSLPATSPGVQDPVNEQTDDEKFAVQIVNNIPVVEDNSEGENRQTNQLIILKPKDIDHLAILTDDFFGGVYQRDAPEPVTILSEVKKPYNNDGKFGIGVFYAPTFYNTFVSGSIDNGIVETGNSFIYSGNYGAEIKYHLNDRLAIRTGIARSQVKSWSQSEADFTYDLSSEHIMPDGEKENTSAVPMLTPFGEVNTEITYRFPGDEEIPDGEVMNSILETHQDIEYLSIPLGIEYAIIPFSHFSWFTEGGIRFNWASGDATEFTSRILHFGEDMSVVNQSMSSHPDYKSNYFDFYLGTGLNFQFSESFLIGGSFRYSRNINKVNIQENLSTNVQAVGLKLGIIYLF